MNNIFLIGAMKCGTNSLYNYLKQDERIATHGKKELNYFIEAASEQWYAERFSVSGTTVYTLDGTTQYSKYPFFGNIAERIYQFNPKAKIVYVMRDPLDRIESNVAHYIARGNLGVDTWYSSQKAEEALNIGRYYTQIGPFLNRFGRENVFLGVFEEMISDFVGFSRRLYGFLDLDHGARVERGVAPKENVRRVDKGAGEFRLTDEQCREFAGTLEPEVELVGEILEVEVNRWWTRYCQYASR